MRWTSPLDIAQMCDAHMQRGVGNSTVVVGALVFVLTWVLAYVRTSMTLSVSLASLISSLILTPTLGQFSYLT